MVFVAIVAGLIVAMAPAGLGVLGAVALLIGMLAAPSIGVLALVAIRPLVDQSETLFGVASIAGQSPSAILGLGILVSSFMLIIGSQRSRRVSEWFFSSWFFAVYILALSVLAADFVVGFGVAGRVLSWVMLASAILLLPDTRLLYTWVPRVAAMSSLLIVASAGIGYVLAPRSFYGAGEAVGFFFNTQGLAFPLIMMMPALLIGVGRRDRWNTLCLAGLVLGTGVVFMSLSRTAWIAWVVAVLTSIRMLREIEPQTRKRLLFGVVTSALVVGAAALLRWDSVILRFSDVQAGGSLEAVGSGRGAIYMAIASAFLGASFVAKIFGSGLGGSVMVTSAAIGAARVAHSDLLWILYETGVVGLLLFVGGMSAVVRALRIASRQTRSPWASAALTVTGAMLCMAAFNGVITDGSMTYYAVILGLGLRSGLDSVSDDAEGGAK